MSTPKVCRKCARVIGWYDQDFRGDSISKFIEFEWNCPICKQKENK